MSKAKSYSLWLMPTGEVYDRLNTLISQLSREYYTPYFKPHVTLIGEVLDSENEVISNIAHLTSVIHPYRIELGRVQYRNEYFRCLFLKAKETDEVMRANQEARKIFSRQSDLKYMPHLSLMYGDFTTQTKEEIIADIGREISVGFDVDSIHLFSTDGAPKDWYRVKQFSLYKV
jgi:2'-5' RNA ligase